jgi:hypothetical protein
MIGALIPLTGFLSWLFDRRHKASTTTRDSTAAAITAVADASHTIVDVVGDLLEPLKAQLETQQESIEQNNRKLADQEIHVKRLELRMNLVVSYTKRLRLQIEAMGHEPVDLPEELEDLYKE